MPRARANLLTLLLVTALLPAARAEPPFEAPFHAYEVPGSIRFVATAEVNDDGHADVIVAHGDSSLTILFGDGAGTLTSRTDLVLSSRPAQAVAADVNGDSRTDLLVASATATMISVLLAQAGGTFVPMEVGLDAVPRSLAASDIDHDGRVDLVVALRTGFASLLGNGDGTFGPARSHQASAFWVVLGDLNRDGHADAVTVDSGCSPSPSSNVCVSLLTGNGDGTFAPPTGILPELWFPTWAAVEDVNADGAPDVIAARGRLSWLGWPGESMVILGNGEGTFQPVTTLSTGEYGLDAITLGDWNGDGRKDFFFSTSGTNSHQHCDYAALLLGNAAGSFGNSVRVPLPQSLSSASSADLDEDAREEIIVAHRNWVCVLPGQSATPREHRVGVSPASLATAHVDANRNADIVVANYTSHSVSVLVAGRDGVLQPAVDYATGNGPRSVVVGDVNGDLTPDLVVANEVGTSISILLGRGDGSFEPSNEFGTEAAPVAVAIGDFDRDESADLVVAHSTADRVSILRGDGTGSFSPVGPVATVAGPVDVDVGHLDADEYLDIAVTSNTSDSVSLLFGDGWGGFSSRVDLPIGARPSAGSLDDFDADGHADIAVAVENEVRILYGNGSGFETPQAYHTGVSGGFASGDMNADGLPDLAATGDRKMGLVCVLLNSGQRFFDVRHVMGIGPQNRCWGDHDVYYPVFHRVALGDFDGDRQLDIVACNSRQFVSLLLNRMDRVTPVILSDVRAWTDSRGVLLSWHLEVRGGDTITGVRVQRAENRAGPFEERTPVALEPKASMSFDDLDVVPGRQYWYNLVLVFGNGATSIGATIEVVAGGASTWVTALEAAYQPGPAQPVHVRYSIQSPTAVELALFDVRGRRLAMLDAGFRSSGRYHLLWQPLDSQGKRLARGHYLVHLRAGSTDRSRKFLLLHP